MSQIAEDTDYFEFDNGKRIYWLSAKYLAGQPPRFFAGLARHIGSEAMFRIKAEGCTLTFSKGSEVERLEIGDCRPYVRMPNVMKVP